MAPTSLTLNYDALLTTTMFNVRKVLQDQISKAHLYLFWLMRERPGGYRTVEGGLGERAQFPLMYAFPQAEPYAGYDIMDMAPFDGITSAFYEWRQFAVSVMISRIEERKNSGDKQILNLLKSKIKQATIGIKEKFSKAVVQGNGINVATQITTPYQNPSTSRRFVEPLFNLVRFNPAVGTVGEIDPAVDTWWRNKFSNSAAGTYAQFLYELDDLWTQCDEGAGGTPDLNIADRRTYLLYVAALRNQNRFTQFKRADIPFDVVDFHGNPVGYDSYMPDVANGTTVQSNTSGTWAMLNTEFIYIQYDPETNFAPTDFMKPVNQDAKVSFIQWYGAHGTDNRQKHGVMGSIDTTIAA